MLPDLRLEKSIKENIEIKTFIKENSPTTIKRRFIDKSRNIKLFKIEYLNDAPISKKLEDDVRLKAYNMIFHKCNIKAFELEDEFNLPLHLKMPVIKENNSLP